MKLPELEKLLDIFYQISGMEIAVFDSKFHTITAAKHQFPHFCHAIHRYSKCTELCRNSDLENLKEVKKNRCETSYVCPFGFYTAIFPIKREGEIMAYLTIAPAIKDGQSKNLPVEILKNTVSGIDESNFSDLLLKVPVYEESKLALYSELARLIVSQIEEKRLIGNFQNNSIAVLVKNYIDENLSQKITLSDLSLHLHCSTVTITEKFRKKYGKSVMRYVLEERMKLASELLSERGQTVSIVAASCGFPDVEYFSKTFKSYHGKPPSIWRRNAYK